MPVSHPSLSAPQHRISLLCSEEKVSVFHPMQFNPRCLIPSERVIHPSKAHKGWQKKGINRIRGDRCRINAHQSGATRCLGVPAHNGALPEEFMDS